MHLILDPLRMHCSAEGAVSVAYQPWRFHVHGLPLHASWLSFSEAWSALLTRTCLARSDLADVQAAAATITACIAPDNAHHAHPFPGKKGIRFYHRLKDKLAAATPLAA